MNPPDFIIIGAMKCATSSLHSQLARQAGVFMTTPKEPNFFSDDDQYRRGTDWYKNLFVKAGANDILGESSTHYSKLPDYPHTISRLKEWKDECKFIYVMRHPVDRLVSHYIHQWTEGAITCDLNQAIDNFPELVDYSCYARQLKPYIDQFGRDSILPVFYESISTNPQPELDRIGAFLCYPGKMKWHLDLESENVSSERIRKFPGYSLLVKSGVATTLRRLLVPRSFRNLVKDRLRMKQRPELSKDRRTYLEKLFDDDLASLRELLGLSLRCESFSDLESLKNIINHFDRFNIRNTESSMDSK